MSQDKAGLIAIAGDLHAMGFTAADIARAVGRSQARIGQILRAIGRIRPPIKSVDDLPHDMRERVLLWRASSETKPIVQQDC